MILLDHLELYSPPIPIVTTPKLVLKLMLTNKLLKLSNPFNYISGSFKLRLLQAAVTVFLNKQAIVIGPTPPGTGVIADATFETLSKSTSPTKQLFVAFWW